ncbi:MAG TPA: UDP-3-O-(3-hydroxymyristoyl)glucosamine N-acyltransferase [Thermoanaerobaculia bacterium]|nr:UDP-3-O-(3-hydroxymyristoyl)glucosamine N-acyltransferase [Thermoanaerobaculia bacterium]
MARSRVQSKSAGTRGRSGSHGAGWTLDEVASAVGGRVARGTGARFSSVAPLETAGPADLSWVADERHVRDAEKSRAGALLVASEALSAGKPCVVVERPPLALALCLEVFHPAPRRKPGVARGAWVHRSARLDKGVTVAPGATVCAGARVGARTILSAGSYVGENASVGEDCVLGPTATLADGCRIGDRCILHAGAVVGSDGFGYVWDGARHRKIPQVGIVRIEDDVEVGANAAIDRATLGETVIGRGTKIDNLVQIGHNVVVGEHALLCGQAGVGGSSRLGRGVTLAGQVGVSDHVTIGDGAVLTGQAGIARRGRVEAGAVVSGMPALPHREFLKRAALLGRLDAVLERLSALEAAVAKSRKGG